MSKTIDTFSSNSLKILDKSLEEFKNKYIYNLSFFKKEERALLGEKFHSLICAYLKNIPISKMIFDLDDKEKIIWNNLQNFLKDKKENFKYTEYPFLIKEELGEKFYYLTGRIDAIYKENDFYTIYDWKTLNLPKNPQDDLQSVVYLYCASKIFDSENIKIKYLSIEKLDFVEVKFNKQNDYKKRIDSIIEKYYFWLFLNICFLAKIFIMKKYAFTLAEILIVMTVIGTIAALCVPAIMLGITNARYQAAYKKAYRAVHSIMAIEQLNGKLPTKTTKESVAGIFESLLENLSIKEFAPQEKTGPNDGVLTKTEDFKTSISYTGKNGKQATFGYGNNILQDSTDWTSNPSPWIVTEDNLAYSVIGISNSDCATKEELNTINQVDELNRKSCAIIIIDVNGLIIGPNLVEDQVINGIEANSKTKTLSKDRYYIYVGKNGTATGPKTTSLSGRLINNL